MVHPLLESMINLETHVTKKIGSQSEYELLIDSVGKIYLVNHITAVEIPLINIMVYRGM